MNEKRMVENFKNLVMIHSPSGNERRINDFLIEEFKKRGMSYYEDDGYKNFNGNAGVLFAKLKGNNPDLKPITLQAHSDVVEPNFGVEVVSDGKIIRTKGDTTLGADDKGGVAIIFEVLDSLMEDKKTYPDIYVMITVGEENGLIGVKHINWDKVSDEVYPAKDTIVIDNAGRSGLIAYQAPGAYHMTIEFFGRKAHGGIEPEKGINAIVMASKAISKFNTGRIDKFTTSNIGSIESNFPTNVVSDYCKVVMEARGHDEEVLTKLIDSYEEACVNAAKEMGGECKFSRVLEFPQLHTADDLKLANLLKKEYEKLGVDSELQIIGGGSDANILSAKGFNSVILGCGMYKVHTSDEYLVIEDMVNTTKAILGYIDSLSSEENN